MAQELSDPRRTQPPFVAGERTMLEAWLDYHRATLLLKCEGLDDAARKARPVTTSRLSLHGLVRHMAEVERAWFQRVLLGQQDTPYLYGNGEDSDFFPVEKADWDADLSQWHAACASSRAAAAGRTLDDVGVRHGEARSLRWIYLHMIEEYARHNGHADLLREMIDGSVGD